MKNVIGKLGLYQESVYLTIVMKHRVVFLDSMQIRRHSIIQGNLVVNYGGKISLRRT
jgi:hypothetical protein